MPRKKRRIQQQRASIKDDARWLYVQYSRTHCQDWKMKYCAHFSNVVYSIFDKTEQIMAFVFGYEFVKQELRAPLTYAYTHSLNLNDWRYD